MLKASPVEEGGRRIVYIEASNEALDQQGEVVLAKALEESSAYFLRYGNLDLDHITQVGAKSGIRDYALYEIGRPVEVRIDGRRTFVKGELFQGDSPVAQSANMFWDSITKVQPPQRWYPSVGGAVTGPKEVGYDDTTKARQSVVTKVRWTNIGFSKTPVNPAVPTVAAAPFGVFAKSWSAAGLDLDGLVKAIEAGYGTDSATLAGGGALRRQSLHGAPINYFDFREQIASAMLKKSVKDPTAERLVALAVEQYGMSRADAAEWVSRFMGDLNNGLKQRKRA